MKWYKYDIRELSDKEYYKWYSLMSVEKQRRVGRFRFEDDKKRTVAGELLARKAISEWCGVAPENITFSAKEYGKPYAIGLDVEFNVSHSGDIVVCAIDDYPIGIDVEKIRPIDLKVAEKICNEEELLYLLNHIPTKQDFTYTTDIKILTRFYEVWTKKEAFGKYTGMGLSDECANKDHFFESIYSIKGYIITICKRINKADISNVKEI